MITAVDTNVLLDVFWPTNGTLPRYRGVERSERDVDFAQSVIERFPVVKGGSEFRGHDVTNDERAGVICLAQPLLGRRTALVALSPRRRTA